MRSFLVILGDGSDDMVMALAAGDSLLLMAVVGEREAGHHSSEERVEKVERGTKVEKEEKEEKWGKVDKI